MTTTPLPLNLAVVSPEPERHQREMARCRGKVLRAIRRVDLQNQRAVKKRAKRMESLLARISIGSLIALTTKREGECLRIKLRACQLLHALYHRMQEEYLRSLQRPHWRLHYYEVKDSKASPNRVYLVGEESLEEVQRLSQWKENFLQGAERLLSRCSRVCMAVVTDTSIEHPLLRKALVHKKVVVAWERKEDLDQRAVSSFEASEGSLDDGVAVQLQGSVQCLPFREMLQQRDCAMTMRIVASKARGEQKEVYMSQGAKRVLIDQRNERFLAEIHKLFSAGVEGDSLVMLASILIESREVGLVHALSKCGYTVSAHPLRDVS